MTNLFKGIRGVLFDLDGTLVERMGFPDYREVNLKSIMAFIMGALWIVTIISWISVVIVHVVKSGNSNEDSQVKIAS